MNQTVHNGSLARLRTRDAARKKLKARIQGTIVARPRSVSPKVDHLRVDQEFKEARMNSKAPNSLRFTGSASQGRQIRHPGRIPPGVEPAGRTSDVSVRGKVGSWVGGFEVGVANLSRREVRPR